MDGDIMLKKLLAAGLLTVAFTAAPLFDAEVMPDR